MRPLTDATPKPLLPVQGRPMIQWHLQALARSGVQEVVINTAWLEDQFPQSLGDGSTWGLRIHYSQEGRQFGGALETAGGLATALPLMGLSSDASAKDDAPLWLVAGDIFAPDFDYAQVWAQAVDGGAFAPNDLAHLWLVPNPEFHPRGDFCLHPAGSGSRLRRPAAQPGSSPTYTYSSLALVRPSLVQGVATGTRAALGPLLMKAADEDRLSGSIWTGAWHNVGTPQQLLALGQSNTL